MEFFRIKRDIPFMRHALVLNVISFITFALAVFFLFTRGLHLSIEFTGGTVMEVSTRSRPTSASTRATVEAGLRRVQVQNFGTSRDVLIRLPCAADKQPRWFAVSVGAQQERRAR
jgi:preprotein translocase subunit SecF